MITVEKYGIILSPTENEFENNGVLNPGIYQEGDTVHILYRADQKGNLSTIGYAKTDGTNKVVDRNTKPLIIPELEFEKNGIKDARIVKIEDVFYITYAAYDGINSMGALAISKDLIHFEKQGTITPPINYAEYEKLILKCGNRLNPKYHNNYNFYKELGLAEEPFREILDKDIVFFPKKIKGKFAMLHSIWPGIQIVYFDHWKYLTKSFWENYLENLSSHIVMNPKGVFEVNYIGVGCPPIETKEGWLLIYYGVQETALGNLFHVKAALLELENPEIEITRLSYPLFSPTKQWEIEGEVDNVVFPTGHALFKNDLYIYYGAANKQIAVAKMNINKLLLELKKANVSDE
jgi:predicted GH43/DUF377 family glycosyl hydrolase